MSPNLLDPFRFGVRPDQIPDLHSWHKADVDVFSDAGITPAVHDDLVQQWNDQSGNGRHFSMATSAARPKLKTNVINGQPVLRFDDEGLSDLNPDRMQDDTLNRPLTAFIVYCYNGAASGARRALCGSGNWLIGPYNGQHSFFGGGGFVANTDAPVTQFQFIGACATQSGTNGVASFFVNTVDKTDTPGNSTDGPATLGLGANNPFGEPLDGDVAEVITYSRVLSALELAQVHTYLKARYALW